MEDGWIVIIENASNEEIYRFPFLPNIPVPSIGHTVWVPTEAYEGSGYEATYVDIEYDKKTVIITTNAKLPRQKEKP